MPGFILTAATTMMCPHGGQIKGTPSQFALTVDGMPALLQTDLFVVTGCPFMIGTKPSPCVTVQWTGGSPKITVQGKPVLVQSSVGLCKSPEQAPQGAAIIVSTQVKMSEL